MLGRLHKIAQNSVEAEKAYKKVLDIDPNHEDALTGLAVVYADLGDSQRSSDLVEETDGEESLAAYIDGARQPV